MGNITNIGTIDYTNLVYSSNDKDIKQFSLKKGDLVFNRTNSSEWVGKTAIYKGERPAIFAGYLIRIRPIIINADFLNYVMNSCYYKNWCYQVKTDAVNQSNINAQKLSQLMLPIPPLSEQQRIVKLVKQLHTIIEQLEANKQNLYLFIKQTKSKILDLAIHGKLVSQNPNDEPASELLKRINPKAEITCDNTHYPQLPNGWSLVTMSEVCKLTDGEKRNNIKHINLDVKFLRKEVERKYLQSGRYISKDSFLILIDGENSGEVFQTPIEGYQGSTFKQLSISEYMNQEYVVHIINQHKKLLRESKVGSTIPHLNKKLFKAINILVPPYREQCRIVNCISGYYEILGKIAENL